MAGKDSLVPPQHKHAALLVLLLASIAIQSFDARGAVTGALSDAFRIVLGLTIFFVVFHQARERAGMAVIIVTALAIGVARHFASGEVNYVLSLVFHALMALFLWVTVWVILRGLFRTPTVGAENVLGAVCGYLIAGNAWADVNALTYLLVPAAYSINPEVNLLLADWQGRQALFSYYSLAQMLTIGYSDVTPIRAPATTLSLFAALFGMFYTAIVVSQLVGMAQSRRSRGHGDE